MVLSLEVFCTEERDTGRLGKAGFRGKGGLTAIRWRHPAPGWNMFLQRQVSWLADQHQNPVFPGRGPVASSSLTHRLQLRGQLRIRRSGALPNSLLIPWGNRRNCGYSSRRLCRDQPEITRYGWFVSRDTRCSM